MKLTVYVVGCLSLSLISNLEWDFVLPERKPFIAVSFWHSSDLLCLVWNVGHVLPERNLFIALVHFGVILVV